MNDLQPPSGYRTFRPLSERAGSCTQLATNPAGEWCCLKLQRAAHPAALAELANVRSLLVPLTSTEGLMPVSRWGTDPGSGGLWEEMPLADNLLNEGRFLPGDPESYTPLSLMTWLTENGPAATSQVIQWGIRLACALTQLHDHGLFHRDVKPANILFFRGEPVLADYGSVGSEGSVIEFPGTEGYVPPDGMGSPALDVFALGRTLYELWTGLDRFHFPSLPPAVTSSTDWNRHGWMLNAALLRAAEGRPSRRFPDANQFREALENAGRGNYRFSRRKLIAASAMGVGGVAAAYVWRNRPSHRAVWRKLPPARFGYEHWQGNELTCNWKERVLYSVGSAPDGTHLQSYDLRSWQHRSWHFPAASKRALQAVLAPSGDELWAVEYVTGEVLRIRTDGSSALPVGARPVNENDFTGALYWNPLNGRIGRFAGYGNMHVHNRRREYDPVVRQWTPSLQASGDVPWPRQLPFLMFPGRDRTNWYVFGGDGNRSGRQGEIEPGLDGYTGIFHPLDDFWNLDLTTGQWRRLLPVQQWRPTHLKAAIYHAAWDSVLFLTGSAPGQTQSAGLHLWPHNSRRKPQSIPASGDVIPLFRCWTLLVEPDTQDLWVFADEGVFAVSMRPA
jgi:serine/threonine protein kinase